MNKMKYDLIKLINKIKEKLIKWLYKPTLKIDLLGNKLWRLNGKCHREDGPAIEWHDGSKEWWVNGIRHRVDGPAIIYAVGYKKWFLYGKLHRVDGPAVDWSSVGYREWYLNDKRYSKEEWFQKLTSEQQQNYLWSLGD
jgi:hypothetical protein